MATAMTQSDLYYAAVAALDALNSSKSILKNYEYKINNMKEYEDGWLHFLSRPIVVPIKLIIGAISTLGSNVTELVYDICTSHHTFAASVAAQRIMRLNDEIAQYQRTGSIASSEKSDLLYEIRCTIAKIDAAIPALEKQRDENSSYCCVM